MSGSQQAQTMQLIREYFKVNKSQRPAYFCMSSDQIALLANNHLFQIGGHTESHPALSAHSKEFQYREIYSNKIHLQELISKPVELFAYPSGRFNDITIRLLKEMKFSAAFTTVTCPVQKNSDLHKLGRFQVNNWQGDVFFERILSWLH